MQHCHALRVQAENVPCVVALSPCSHLSCSWDENFYPKTIPSLSLSLYPTLSPTFPPLSSHPLFSCLSISLCSRAHRWRHKQRRAGAARGSTRVLRQTQVHACMYVYIYIYIYHIMCILYVYIMYIYIYTYMYVCMYYIWCVCVYIYIYIYIHVYTHYSRACTSGSVHCARRDTQVSMCTLVRARLRVDTSVHAHEICHMISSASTSIICVVELCVVIHCFVMYCSSMSGLIAVTHVVLIKCILS